MTDDSRTRKIHWRRLRQWWVWKPMVPRLLMLPVLALLGYILGPAVQRHDWVTAIWTLLAFGFLTTSLLLSDHGWDRQG